MLNDLISLTHSYQFEEYGALNFVGLRVESNVLRLSLDVEIRSEIETQELWEVNSVGVLGVVILAENSYVVAPTFNARRLREAEI